MEDKFTKNIGAKAVKIAVEKYGFTPLDDEPGVVILNEFRIDLTASGDEDWQVGRNIIRQIIEQVEVLEKNEKNKDNNIPNQLTPRP